MTQLTPLRRLTSLAGLWLLSILMLGTMLSGCQASTPTLEHALQPEPELETIREVNLEPEEPGAADDIVAIVSSTAGNHSERLRYEWLKNGVLVPDVKDAHFPARLTEAGDHIRVRVSLVDTAGAIISTASRYVLISRANDSLARGSSQEGVPCKHDKDCGKGSCGFSMDGVARCVGSSQGIVNDAEEVNKAMQNLQHETEILLAAKKAQAARGKSRRSSGRRGSAEWDAEPGGTASSSSRSRQLRLGDPCGRGQGFCGSGLMCQGAGEVRTCVPSR